MCGRLRDLQNPVARYAGAFDIGSLTPSQAGEVVRLCAQIESSVASVKALAAARSAEGAEGNDWKVNGFRSAEDQLARQTGMSPTNAKKALWDRAALG